MECVFLTKKTTTHINHFKEYLLMGGATLLWLIQTGERNGHVLSGTVLLIKISFNVHAK